VSGNSLADDRGLDGKMSRSDFLKLIFGASSAITLFPLTQLIRIYGSHLSNADINDRYRVGEVDRFGIKEFYPTKENGLEWFADWDKGRTVNRNSFDPYDSRFGLANGTGLIIGHGKARIRAFNASHRLFVKGPWLNTEQTIYIKVLSDGRASSIQLRSRSNHHGIHNLPYPDVGYLPKPVIGREINTCGFGNYLVKWGEKQLDFVSIELEIIHALYRRHLLYKPFVIPKDKYIGFKTVTRTVQNGQVKLEGYNNLDVSSQSNWKKTIEFLFDGANAAVTDSILAEHQSWLDYCKDKGDKISGNLNNHQIWNKPSYWNWIRITNAENIDLKYYSVREIQ
jgi:hypothetical protein